MKRTQLARRTPLRRKTWLRRKSKTKKYARRERDLDYMKLVKRLPCIVRTWEIVRFRIPLAQYGEPVLDVMAMPPITPCTGHVQADHAGKRPYGQKAPDDTCIPLCKHHHGERTDYRGTFHWWDGADMRAWCEWAIARTRADVDWLRQKTVGMFAEPEAT